MKIISLRSRHRSLLINTAGKNDIFQQRREAGRPIYCPSFPSDKEFHLQLIPYIASEGRTTANRALKRTVHEGSGHGCCSVWHSSVATSDNVVSGICLWRLVTTQYPVFVCGD